MGQGTEQSSKGFEIMNSKDTPSSHEVIAYESCSGIFGSRKLSSKIIILWSSSFALWIEIGKDTIKWGFD